MIIIEKSKETNKQYTTTDPIFLFLQFYIDKDITHHKEIQFALQKNVENPHIHSILLLNERIYSDTELGVTSSKIKQVIINQRITYKHFLNYDIETVGYKVLINADIFLDESINHIKTSNLHLPKNIFALLRYEYNNNKPYLFSSVNNPNGRGDSQDTWIIHTNQTFSKKVLNTFNIQLGIPGCDNKILYLFKILGYDLYNDPSYIKTYHCHQNTSRNYTNVIDVPYLHLYPYSYIKHPIETIPCTFISSNNILFHLLNTSKPVLIPRIAGVENNLMLTTSTTTNPLLPVMKRNAGIYITNNESLHQYKQWYLSAFEKSDAYAIWESWGNVYKYIANSHTMITTTYNKPVILATAFDIFHYIYLRPWTHALAGKRILIISSFIESIQKQPQVYPIDLFPNCTFVYLKPPQTNGDNSSQDWFIEFNTFCQQIHAIQDTFDVALCSCGGYGNPVCSYIFSLNKSAIYVGGVLQMYFGIYGTRWLKERKEVMNLFMTSDWKRPANNEKPQNHSSIENGCYW
jgi:hypothetical protein